MATPYFDLFNSHYSAAEVVSRGVWTLTFWHPFFEHQATFHTLFDRGCERQSAMIGLNCAASNERDRISDFLPFDAGQDFGPSCQTMCQMLTHELLCQVRITLLNSFKDLNVLPAGPPVDSG